MPRDYDVLQPFEVADLEEAARWRRDREWERQARVGAFLMLPNVPKEVFFDEVYDELVKSLAGYRPEE